MPTTPTRTGRFLLEVAGSWSSTQRSERLRQAGGWRLSTVVWYRTATRSRYAKRPRAVTTAGHPRSGLRLGYPGCWIATTMSYSCGRNPAPLIGKMKKLLRHPGGHNRLGYSDTMTAGAGGWGSVGLLNPDGPLTFRHSGGVSEGLPLLGGAPTRTHGPRNPRWPGRYESLDCHLRP
jgi:hypothetical protein